MGRLAQRSWATASGPGLYDVPGCRRPRATGRCSTGYPWCGWLGGSSSPLKRRVDEVPNDDSALVCLKR